MLKSSSIPLRETTDPSDFSVCITVDRTRQRPCIIVSPSADANYSNAWRYPFDYTERSLHTNPSVKDIASRLGLSSTAQEKVGTLIQAMWQIFNEKEGYLLKTRVGKSATGELEVHAARFGFDDAAFRSSGRQEAVQQLRNKAEEVPEEVEAEKDGIVYVKSVPRHQIQQVLTNSDSKAKAASEHWVSPSDQERSRLTR